MAIHLTLLFGDSLILNIHYLLLDINQRLSIEYRKIREQYHLTSILHFLSPAARITSVFSYS